jgi:hypothetical protein
LQAFFELLRVLSYDWPGFIERETFVIGKDHKIIAAFLPKQIIYCRMLT